MQGRTAGWLVVWAIVAATPGLSRTAAAEDAFYDLTLAELDFGGKQLPEPAAPRPQVGRIGWQGAGALDSYAVLDVAGEAYLGDLPNPWTPNFGTRHLLLRAPANADVKGVLFVPNSQATGLERLPFRVPRSAAKADAGPDFYAAKLASLDRLIGRRIPGGAWFRHQFMLAREVSGRLRAVPTDAPFLPARTIGSGNIGDVFEYLTGGRAMSENLQLDRLPRETRTSPAAANDVELTSLRGISVAAIDWSRLVAGINPRLDRLARFIPADQHVVFFPTFERFVQVVDEGLAGGTPILQWAEPRSEDAQALERYQRQLGLSLSGVGRLVGPKVVRSVALTGSDPFYRSGTDLAILFEAADPAALEKLLRAQIALAAANEPGARPIEGQVGTLKYHGLRSPDRGVCSYVAKLASGVVVTNSPAQLERLAAVAAGESPTLESLDEFKFFRHRYSLDDAEETAFLFLSDATIRRWCGPRWRIAEWRRMRDLAVMSDLQATYLGEVVRSETKSEPLTSEFALAAGGELRLTAAGVESSVLGTLGFQTPVAELPLDRVTAAEADAYRFWRERYERNWRWAFDPIGLRISLAADRVAGDLTVLPLIAGSEYRNILSVTQGAAIKPGAGDPHAALGQLVLAINRNSPRIQQANGMARMFAPNLTIDPLAWLGSSVSVYLDDDPLWAELAKTPEGERQTFLEKNWPHLPLGVQIEVGDALKLTAFLVAARGFIDQATGNMLKWETFEHRGRSYVKISLAEPNEQTPELRDAAIFYSPSASALVVTLSEAVLKRAIDRQLAASGGPKAGGAEPAKKPASADAQPAAVQPATVQSPNVQPVTVQPAAVQPAGAAKPLGENLLVHADARMVDILSALGRESYQGAMQRLAWSNLPILNEWHRLYPDADPVAVHERVWHTRLVCPGGGKYVWNEAFRTMESTVYGHPGEPQPGPAAPAELRQFSAADFGLTFENQGLRARVNLPRAKTDQKRADEAQAPPAKANAAQALRPAAAAQ